MKTKATQRPTFFIRVTEKPFRVSVTWNMSGRRSDTVMFVKGEHRTQEFATKKQRDDEVLRLGKIYQAQGDVKVVE